MRDTGNYLKLTYMSLSPPHSAELLSHLLAQIINKTKMDSLKFVAAKVKHSPQVIRKTFSSSHSPYAKVLEGEKSKGKSGEHDMNIAEQVGQFGRRSNGA